MLGPRQCLIFYVILLWLKRITMIPILSLQEIKCLSEKKTRYLFIIIQHEILLTYILFDFSFLLQNYLDFVYKTLFQDLEKLQTEIDDSYVTKCMTSILQFISVRLQLLELYDKLYEIGTLNSWINFSELSETVENIQNDLINFSPVDQVLRIVR